MSFSPGGNSGGGGSISTSGDVALNNPASGQFLSYDGSVAKWTNSAASRPNVTKAVIVYNTGSSTYPPRPSGYGSVEWIGPVDPGAAALNFDTWVNTAE